MKPRRVNVDRMRRYRERDADAAWWAMTPAERMESVFDDVFRILRRSATRPDSTPKAPPAQP